MLKPRLLSELGEQLCPWSSPNARTDDHLKLATNLVNLQPAIGREQPDAPAMEEFKQLAEKEKHAALRLQKEVNIRNPQVNHVKKVINTDILDCNTLSPGIQKAIFQSPGEQSGEILLGFD